jgi:hypothetical protein
MTGKYQDLPFSFVQFISKMSNLLCQISSGTSSINDIEDVIIQSVYKKIQKLKIGVKLNTEEVHVFKASSCTYYVVMHMYSAKSTIATYYSLTVQKNNNNWIITNFYII